jgi:hypothetical protein
MTSVSSQLSTANFAKLLNNPNFSVNMNAKNPTPAPVVQTPVSKVEQVMNGDHKENKIDTDNFQLDLFEKVKVKESVLDLQYAHAKFVFKVPRVKNELEIATLEDNVKKTIQNLQKEQNKGVPDPEALNKFSVEEQNTMLLAQQSYRELSNFKNTKGQDQYKKDLEKWNNLKVADSNGNETTQLTPTYVKILRDIFTIDFKTEADMALIYGSVDLKAPEKNSGIKAWVKEHKELKDKPSIRTSRNGLRVNIVFTYNSANPQASDAIVVEFRTWLLAHIGHNTWNHDRKTDEFKLHVYKDKKSGQVIKKEKRKPSPPVVDPLVNLDPLSFALKTVTKLKNRFSNTVSVAMTVFIDYVVWQFTLATVLKCHEKGKKPLSLEHIVDSAPQVDLYPLVSNFTCFKELHNGSFAAKFNEEDDEKQKKHDFEYCVYGVFKQAKKELHEKFPNNGYDKINSSAKYKMFMCVMVDELIERFGPILRQEIVSNQIKTVNLLTFYNVLGVLLSWHKIKFDDIKNHIEERVELYKTFNKTNKAD